MNSDRIDNTAVIDGITVDFILFYGMSLRKQLLDPKMNSVILYAYNISGLRCTQNILTVKLYIEH